jgi:hypothetical protein
MADNNFAAEIPQSSLFDLRCHQGRKGGKTPETNLPAEWREVFETANSVAIGYESASGFSTAFNRETGRPQREFIGANRSVA